MFRSNFWFLFCARANAFKLVHSFDMFDRVVSSPLHVFFWFNISEFRHNSFVAKIRILDLRELFHNVIMKMFVLLFVLLDRELHYKFFL